MKILELHAIYNFALRTIIYFSLVNKLHCSKVRYFETKNCFNTQKISQVSNQHFVDTCELFLNLLCTKLDLDLKIKLLPQYSTTTFIQVTQPCKQSKLLFNFSQTSIMKMAFQMKPTLRSKIGLGHEYKHCSIYHPRCV